MEIDRWEDKTGNNSPQLGLAGAWWYRAMSLHELGEQTEARRIYNELTDKLFATSIPRIDSLRYHELASELLGVAEIDNGE